MKVFKRLLTMPERLSQKLITVVLNITTIVLRERQFLITTFKFGKLRTLLPDKIKSENFENQPTEQHIKTLNRFIGGAYYVNV